MFINNTYIPLTSSTVDFSMCEDVINKNLYLFESAYRACCGYHNISTAYQNIAVKIFNLPKDKLNWQLFDEYWEKLFKGYDHVFIRAWLTLFNYADLKNHITEITTLLFNLCQIN